MKKLLALVLATALLGGCVVTAATGEMMYLIPDSDSRKLTTDELWTWDYESLGYILNEIFARHGYVFIAGEKYDYYFRSMPWYTPNADPDNRRACYSQLNSIEWYNEGLVKQVRAEMRETGNFNKGAKSVWDHFSTGFDVLQGFDFVELQENQKFEVYSAPSAASWRGANGKAAISSNGVIYTDGRENGWLLVMYETNNGGVRVGYIDASKVKGKVKGDAWNQELTFGYLPATITQNCVLTDDPAKQSTSIVTLTAGTQVTYLTTYINRKAWDYIETTVDGVTVRGFVPAGTAQYFASEIYDETDTTEYSGVTDGIG